MKTWILVASSARARLFEAGKSNSHLTELAEIVSQQARMHGSEFTTEHAGRVQESANPARHGIEPRMEPHDRVSIQFAQGLAQMLEQGRIEHEYERLILMAPPRFLGQLRGTLDDGVARLVVASVDKDLSRASVDEIEAMLRS